MRVRIAESPLQLTAIAPESPLEVSGSLAIPFALERRFGFAADVEVTVEIPNGLKGVTAGKVTLAPDQTQGVVELKADEKAVIGEGSVTLRARAKFNEVDVEARRDLRLRVAARPLP